MVTKVRYLRQTITIIEYKAASFNVVNFHIQRLLEQMPNAQRIDITVTEHYDDGQPDETDASYDYTEGGMW